MRGAQKCKSQSLGLRAYHATGHIRHLLNVRAIQDSRREVYEWNW